MVKVPEVREFLATVLQEMAGLAGLAVTQDFRGTYSPAVVRAASEDAETQALRVMQEIQATELQPHIVLCMLLLIGPVNTVLTAIPEVVVTRQTTQLMPTIRVQPHLILGPAKQVIQEEQVVILLPQTFPVLKLSLEVIILQQ